MREKSRFVFKNAQTNIFVITLTEITKHKDLYHRIKWWCETPSPLRVSSGYHIVPPTKSSHLQRLAATRWRRALHITRLWGLQTMEKMLLKSNIAQQRTKRSRCIYIPWAHCHCPAHHEPWRMTCQWTWLQMRPGKGIQLAFCILADMVSNHHISAFIQTHHSIKVSLVGTLEPNRALRDDLQWVEKYIGV